MIFYQTFHRALDDRTQPDTHFAGSFGQYRLVIESHGADKVYLAFTVVFVLHHVTFEECLEAVRYQCAYAGFVQVLCKEWREACQKTVGERLAVYTVDDVGGCQVELREELLLQFGGHLVFQNIAHQQLAQYGAAAFISEDESQWRYVGYNLLAVIVA